MAKKSKKLSAGTGELPLVLARKIAIAAEKSFDHGNGEMMSRVTPPTADLLKYWFCEPFTTERSFNFHEGQRQSILNAVFLHEVLGVRKVSEIYEKIAPELLAETPILSEIGKEKYAFPKYAIKMATGTGKTWVMHALLTWQFLNAKAEKGEPSGRWTKNFLLVAPGIIVYERLLDAYCGRVGAGGMRDFETSDLARFRELFLPPVERENVFGFIQNSVVKKEEIGRKITGEGIVAVTNWHLFLNDEEDSDEAWGDDTKIVSDLLPARPGTSKGNSLEQLDSAYSRGNALEFLENLPDLMVVNDEAHHIHENRKNGIVTQHIIGEIVKVAVEMQKNTETSRAKGDKIQFSSVTELRVRERFSLPLRKTIYERTPFPSNSGGLEKAFLEFLDRDAKVERFIKISETNHDFAKIYYLRADGLLATYHPDFIIATKRNFYLVETKGENQLSDENVRRKCLAAKEWCEQMNNLPSEERENREWKYALLGEKLFYALAENGADIDDLCAHAEISENTVRDDFFS